MLVCCNPTGLAKRRVIYAFTRSILTAKWNQKYECHVWFPWKLCVHLWRQCLACKQGHSLSTFWFCSWWCTCQLSYLQHQHKLSFCHKNKWCSVFSFNRRYDVIQERAWFRACLTLIFKKGCFFKHNMEMTKSEKLLKKTKKKFLWIFFDMTPSKKGRGLELS